MRFKSISTFVFLLLWTSSLQGEIQLPKLISDGMVLQRATEIKIWGWADEGEEVEIDFLNKKYKTIADALGDWSIKISNLKAGGPFEMKIVGNNTITIQNILIGDVWVCSGQSNMELTLERASPLYPKEIANCENSNIRYFKVPRTFNFQSPQKDIAGGKWMSAHPKNILQFSALSYFFADELYQKYQIPIGLINTALGGSPVEAWLSEEALKSFPKHYKEAIQFKDDDLIKRIQENDRNRINSWYQQLNQNDEGYKSTNWKSPDMEDSDWATMDIPGYWADENLGRVNGVVWFRKEIDVPSSMIDKDVKLLLGRIVDADSVFVNGTFVGNTTYQYPPRRYTIPKGVLKEGKNSMVIRVVNNSGRGGFVLDKEYAMKTATEIIDLSGKWKYRLGGSMNRLKGQTAIRWKPMGLYNAMIAPLLNYKIKGVIWYQGESNTRAAEAYDQLFPAMINNWRKDWQQGDFPFLFVQLANFMEASRYPMESNWARLRESQTKALQLPNTGMAVTIDIGEWNDIHPLNKKDIGKRLALNAQRIAYDEKQIVHASPLYQSMKVKHDKIILTFENVGSGLLSKDGGLKEFAIAGKDKKFVWAKAKIKKNKVIVCSNKVKHPVAVRYAWANNPQHANLYNKEGLPASPFRTDDW